MERRQIGIVKELFRYPVKSMLGERLERLEIGERGVIGDRAWALRECINGKIVSAKKFAQMLDCRATYETPPIDGESAPIKIQLPDGRVLHAAMPTPRRSSPRYSAARSRSSARRRASIPARESIPERSSVTCRSKT